VLIVPIFPVGLRAALAFERTGQEVIQPADVLL
jgi:hypothetical protein